MGRGSSSGLLYIGSFPLFQVLFEKFLQFVERNNIRPVIQIRMYGTRNNHQFLIVAFQLLESIFTKITGVGFLAMNK